MLSSMRIAIIGPNFTHGLTYQENMWAEQLARLGHSVRMFHAGKATTPPKELIAAGGRFEEQQVATRFLPRATYSSPALAEAVRAFNPELIVVHGDKLFASHVVCDNRLASVPLVATFSENVGMHEFDWRKGGISFKQRLWALGFRMLRAGPIRRTCRRATLLIGNTPQAREILLGLMRDGDERARVNGKIVDIPLGFSPEQFGFVAEVRKAVRTELGIRDDEIVVCASSHLDAVKAPYMMMIIDALRQVMREHAAARGLIVGFSNSPASAAASKLVTDHLAAGPFDDRFIRHNFANRGRLAQLFNVSDIAVFGRASISCQEALGTGLVGCFADDGAMTHLVRAPQQGVFFRPGDREDLALKLSAAVASILQHAGARDEFRQSLAQASRWLGYDRIIESVLAELAQRTGR